MKGDKKEEVKGGERGGQEWEIQTVQRNGVEERKTEQMQSCGRKRHMEEVKRGNIKTLKSKSTLKTEELTRVA